MSDSDKMRAEFEKWADKQCMSLTRINWKCGTVSEYAYTATFDAWNVWQSAYQAGRKAEREALCIQWEGADATIAEVERLRAELAAAKASSVVPVITIDCYTVNHEIHIACRSLQDCHKLSLWLRERMKERGEQ